MIIDNLYKPANKTKDLVLKTNKLVLYLLHGNWKATNQGTNQSGGADHADPLGYGKGVC